LELLTCRLPEKAQHFPVYFSLLTGIQGRDGFAGGWHHGQTVCNSENWSSDSLRNARSPGPLKTSAGKLAAENKEEKAPPNGQSLNRRGIKKPDVTVSTAPLRPF
jgi:hypothetical protein